MIVDFSSEFIRSLMQGVAAAAVSETAGDGEIDLRFLPPDDVRQGKRISSGWDAFIAQVQDDELADILRATHRPVVDVLYKKLHDGIAVANPDSRAIGTAAARYFIERGFRVFAYCGRPGVAFSDERCAGFRDAVVAAGGRCIVYTVSDSRAASFHNQYAQCDESLENPSDLSRLRNWIRSLPGGTAVLCCHDHRAYQLLRSCEELGRNVPDDIAILGVDNDPVLCGFMEPRISSIDSNARETGVVAIAAVRQMLGRADRRRVQPPRFFVPPKGIVTRESTDTYRFAAKWLSEAVAHIRGHVSENITTADVVAFTGYSHTTVERTFSEQLGMSVQQAIISARLDLAENLLATTDFPLKEVAQRSGFGSVSYFCSSFSRARGMTATEWRNRQR